MSGKTAKSYLPQMRMCILTFLKRRFDVQETLRIYHRIERLEKTYRQEEPYIGGRDNAMSDNLYQAYCMFALYEAMDRKLTAEELQELVDIYFEQKMEHMPKKMNLSFLVRSKFCTGAIYRYLKHYAAKANAKKGREWGNTWGMKVNPDQRQTGLAFNLVGCPLADFARKHDMMEVLPVMCNIDHRTAEALGLKLFRDRTVSAGDAECAYWMVAGKSAEAASFINAKNPDGLILSRIKPTR